jgi:Ca-activated chloride channel family protein
VSFTWPFALLLALVAPALLGVYLISMRRRRLRAVTYSSLALLRSALPRRSRWRRHFPIAALLASLAMLAVAAARPEVTEEIPLGHTTVVLALDESGSMCSTDVVPNRISAAQTAALKFVNSLPSATLAGLVEFNGFAEIAVAPTTDRGTLDQALDNLSVAPGTAIGSAILQALDAIAEVDPKVHPVAGAISNSPIAPSDENGGIASSNSTNGSSGATPKPGKDGYVPDVIVLLTDGANNRGITPIQAVPYAVARGVRIYTIGFGTTDPGPLECTPQEMSGELAPGGGAGGNLNGGQFNAGSAFSGSFGGQNPLVADLPPLQQVSRLTGGVSYRAQDESQLAKVFAALPKEIGVQKEHEEITWLFAALGGLLALVAAAASLRWAPYPS